MWMSNDKIVHIITQHCIAAAVASVAAATAVAASGDANQSHLIKCIQSFRRIHRPQIDFSIDFRRVFERKMPKATKDGEEAEQERHTDVTSYAPSFEDQSPVYINGAKHK